MWPRSPAGVVATAGAVALVGYGVATATRSLDADEAVAVVSAAGALADVAGHALEHDPGQTAHRLILGLLGDAGRPEWFLRLPSAAAVTAAAACVAWMASTLRGRPAGIAAAGVLLLSAGVAEISQLARPYAVAVAALALVSALFAVAMSSGGTLPWVAYALAGAVLPLAHPLAAAIIPVHVAALAVDKGASRSRLATPAVALVAVVGGLLAAASVVDRLDAVGDGDVSVRSLAVGAAAAAGWNAASVALALWGVVLLVVAARQDSRARWQAVLVGGTILAPPAALLVAATAIPLFPRHVLALAAPGLCVAAGIGLAALHGRLAVAAAAAVVATSAAAITLTALDGPEGDWRGAVEAVRAGRDGSESIVVVPERARAALVYYAPNERIHRQARGDGAWVFVGGPRGSAIERARRVVATPRYALLEERSFGDDLVLQHWTRP